MQAKLIECVPNFSEGRRGDVIEAIVDCFRGRRGVALLDQSADRDHNRLVVSLAGEPGPIVDALLEASRAAISHIDLRHHVGGHPRMGAVDVVPFVPLQKITMAECVELAHAFGQRFHEETGVPVYFYEEAALRPERKRLEVVRKGQFEALRTEIASPERHPDVGKPEIHPSAGATIIGARKFLVAFNVNLGTTDLRVAREIAAAIRASSGGLCHVKAIGLSLEDRDMVQVSMNIVDYEKNALYRVLELIRAEARRWGVATVETEICGMVPATALLESAAYYMQLAGFDPDRVIELRLLAMLGKEES